MLQSLTGLGGLIVLITPGLKTMVIDRQATW